MAIIRQNTCHGRGGHLVTVANSDAHGDPWSTVAGHVAYDVRPGSAGWPCLRLGSPVSSTSSSVTRSTGTRDALSVAVYVWVPTGAAVTLSVGGTSAGHPSAVWSTSGGLTLGGATVSSAVASATRDRLVRVEVSASAGTATYRITYVNPLVTAPDYEASVAYTGTLTTVRALAAAGSRAWVDTLRVGEGEWLGSGIIGPASTPGYTASGPWVVLAQEDLMAAGYELPQWGADGFYGAEMSTAVQALQTGHGLVVDGIMGPSARAALDQELNAARYPTAVGPVGWGVPLAA
ncbi:peptidoglycan-binding domain-containing protein [Nocardiopsis sp. HUAS JQ3]|uniref:peptidoglycan-binding domain-containing protein n=1 Tax=Nocardiopsis sp. HUAS JQ3 TaxID=3061629 RepID=UPI0023A9AC72|nr:peptidoglycan-binding domain-containing protein [Nocardiopsis sp. HUAS JQ3]WDZ91131.1 peptidoglycan-binding domain-containing protein [Nocardiopsis sp. HUAS JQ3]